MTARLVTGAGGLALATLALCASVSPLGAQRRPPGGGNSGVNLAPYLSNPGDYFVPPDWRGNPLYEGRVTFVRIKYTGSEKYTNQGPGWAHDYPRAESHFDKIMQEITTMRLFVEKPPIYGSTILALDDPELFKYPIAYLSEPGGWHMTAKELAGFRQYIARGGFIIFDDIGWRGGDADLSNLVYEWSRAFPKAKMMEVPKTHPIFDSFFKIDFTKVRGYYAGNGATFGFFGYFEDNDPKKRLLAVINNANDIGEYMEFSDQGFNPFPTQESYKLAVNYFVYALTH